MAEPTPEAVSWLEESSYNPALGLSYSPAVSISHLLSCLLPLVLLLDWLSPLDTFIP